MSESAQIIAPYHRVIDKVTERFLGKRKIGTTGRGIGPAYADKINRVGIRVHDLFNAEHLHDKVEASLHQKNQMLVKLYNRRAIDVDRTTDELLKLGERLKPYVANTSLVLNRALDAGKTVLFEGGQATMLDVDHGTYPFVTSSNPTAGGACTGTGVGPTKISRVIGVSKAYVTRVGEGPFPTELIDEQGKWLQQQGHEFGVTTGRARRCGWFDAVVNRYAVQVNGLTDIVLTKLDVLTGLKRSRSAWPTTWRTPTARTPATTTCRATRPRSPLPSRSTRRCPAGPRTSPRCTPSRICPRPRRITSSVWRSCPAAGSR